MRAVSSIGEAEPVYIVDGQRINVSTLEEASRLIFERIADDRSFYICTLNLDHIVKLRSNEGFGRIYAGADLVTADGFPIVVLAGLDGVFLQRVTGADLVEPICASAAQREFPVYLIGPSEDAIDRSIEKLRRGNPALTVCGTVAPENFDPVGADALAIIEKVRQSGASICFIGLGAPKQEAFAAFAAERIDGVAFIPVGAALEFLGGTKMRAPQLFRAAGMEWLWRLVCEPRRLSGRYLSSAMVFLELLARRLKGRPQNDAIGVSGPDKASKSL